MHTCMCIYIYIHNQYTQFTHIYYVNKKIILDAQKRESYCNCFLNYNIKKLFLKDDVSLKTRVLTAENSDLPP